jgi:hypothetical protein
LDSIPCIQQGAATNLIIPFVNYDQFTAQGNHVNIKKLRIDTILAIFHAVYAGLLIRLQMNSWRMSLVASRYKARPMTLPVNIKCT